MELLGIPIAIGVVFLLVIAHSISEGAKEDARTLAVALGSVIVSTVALLIGWTIQETDRTRR